MITDAEFAQRAHEVVIECLVGELLLVIGFALLRLNYGYVCWHDEKMAPARRHLAYRWN